MSKEHGARVTEHDGVRTLRSAHAQQSSMLLSDPFDTDFEYPRYLHIAVAVAPHASRAMVIGLGGGTVVKQLWRDHPALEIDAVEIDPEVARLAHSHFAVPEDERVRVMVGDGRECLERAQDAYDIVIVDAFDDLNVPAHLLTQEFALACRARLSEEGVLATNFHGSVTGDRSRPYRAYYRTLASVFRTVWVFPVGLSAGGPAGEHREIITVATDARVSADELLERIASRVDGTVSVKGFERVGADLHRDGIRSGDVALLLDPRR